MTQKEERLKHRRPLSATEKILKIQELKAQGKTQVQIAKELNICRKTICNYWHTTDKISKQEANARERRRLKCVKLLVKDAVMPKGNLQGLSWLMFS